MHDAGSVAGIVQDIDSAGGYRFGGSIDRYPEGAPGISVHEQLSHKVDSGQALNASCSGHPPHPHHRHPIGDHECRVLEIRPQLRVPSRKSEEIKIRCCNAAAKAQLNELDTTSNRLLRRTRENWYPIDLHMQRRIVGRLETRRMGTVC